MKIAPPLSSELSKRTVIPDETEDKSDDMMACEGVQSIALRESLRPSKLPISKGSDNVTCGMLPTLRVLASRGCDIRQSICLVACEPHMDSASHLQTILLEAYCREVGVEVLHLPLDHLRSVVPEDGADLSCVLLLREEPYAEAPE